MVIIGTLINRAYDFKMYTAHTYNFNKHIQYCVVTSKHTAINNTFT